MPKYYIENIQLNKLNDSQLKPVKTNEHLILTHNSLIKLINDNYVKFLFCENKPVEEINNFINETPVLVDNSYFKKKEIIYQIPYDHKIINLDYLKYKINHKSKTQFVIEKVKNKVCDYYFLSNEHINVVQQDIFTFLRLIN